jgi:glutamyl-tRNA synthetase
VQTARIGPVIALLKERVSTIEELADAAVYFYRRWSRAPSCARSTTRRSRRRARHPCADGWKPPSGPSEAISAAMKAVVEAHKLKMPKVAMPLRVMVTGESADAFDRRHAGADRAR